MKVNPLKKAERRKRAYNIEDCIKYYELHKQGVAITVIAKKMKVDRGTVYNYFREIEEKNLYKGNQTKLEITNMNGEPDWKKISALIEDGVSKAYIARQLKTTPERITRKIKL